MIPRAPVPHVVSLRYWHFRIRRSFMARLGGWHFI